MKKYFLACVVLLCCFAVAQDSAKTPSKQAAAKPAAKSAPTATKSAPTPSDTVAESARDKATDEEDHQKVLRFEAQGKIFQNQVKVQKGKIIDIQNDITSLKNEFDAWSTGFAQDDEAQACWTSTYYTPYYKDWCDRGRNLKAQYEASERQLAQEKAKLEKMQEDIRRKGYGNGVYDPD